ncbi:pseudouridine synthase [Mucilaginibacter sp. UR6-1]|uniref:pseudouridine synthase n=1 Tax=Mucilaginibacter sp. UR6-1 TaxID=1435643 RepID=UPI001E39E72E|nr:pseudouridine synthase [Mucilaginibacter sp. UR6-1]MCC8410644.1 pseudouridine synthase [Mucilaginibacter sp. UR6-1]
MVFKRPGNSRDDKSNRSPNKFSKGDDSRRPSSGSRGKFSAKSDKGDNYNPSKKFDKDKTGDRKPFSARGDKPFSPRGDKPFASRGDRPFSSRSDKPTDRPKRSSSEGNEYGDKKPFSSSRPKPYSGRPTDGDRPQRSFGGDRGTRGRSEGGFKKRENSDFKDKPYRERDDRRTRNRDNNEGSDAPVRTMRGRKNPAEPKEKENDGLIRLNRYIANAGICSRRKADELIEAGVVSVNGEVISELGFKVDPAKDVVRYNGETLKREKMVYVLLNKPKDYITTTDDPQERRTVMHLVEKASKERIYPVGRLDRNTTGLLLMTNDGDLADKLSHPRSNIVKLYQVELSKGLTQGDLNKIEFGVELEDGFIKPDSVSYVQGGTKREIGIQIHSGKNRIVRRIFESLGYEVVKLDRVVYAGLTKKDLPRGRWRHLEEKELIQLKHLL